MKVLITGGSGLIGSYLIPELLSHNHHVTIISRSGKIINGVETIHADPTIEGDWMDKIDCDVIINLAGENIFARRWSDKQKKRLIDSRVETTKNMVKLINSSNSQSPLLVSISGSDYYPYGDATIDYKEENSSGDSFLAKLCIEWESPIDACKARSVIFRLGVVFSHTGKTAVQMFLTHKFFIGGWIGSGKQIYSWIHIHDVVSAIMFAINNDIDGVYNLASPDSMEMKKLAKIGGKLLGRWTWTFVPGFILKLLLGERADMLTRGRKLSPEKIISSGFIFKYNDAENALHEIFENNDKFRLKN